MSPVSQAWAQFTSTQPDHTYRVNGSIVDGKDGKPLKSVLIIAFRVERDKLGELTGYRALESQQQATSDRKGKFSLVLNGDFEYAIFSLKDGYKANPYPLKSKSVTKDEVISIEISMSEGRQPMLEGEFVDEETRKKLPNVQVTVADVNSSVIRVVKTDEKGFFRCILGNASAYQVSGHKSGYIPKTFEQLVDLSSAEATAERNFSLKKSRTGDLIPLRSPVFEVLAPQLTEQGKAQLNKLVDILKAQPELLLSIRCHSDARGDDQRNLQRTQEEATVIKNYLISRGISAERIDSQGFGEEQLLNHCANNVLCSTLKHEENRRVEYILN